MGTMIELPLSGGGGGTPSGPAGGDLNGTYPNPSVNDLNGDVTGPISNTVLSTFYYTNFEPQGLTTGNFVPFLSGCQFKSDPNFNYDSGSGTLTVPNLNATVDITNINLGTLIDGGNAPVTNPVLYASGGCTQVLAEDANLTYDGSYLYIPGLNCSGAALVGGSLSLGGSINELNNVNSQGAFGVPLIVASGTFTTQSNSISSTAILSVHAASGLMFEISIALICTASGAGLVQTAITFEDDSSTSQTLNVGTTLSLASKGSIGASAVFNANNSAQIHIQTTVSGKTGSPTYNLYYAIKELL